MTNHYDRLFMRNIGVINSIEQSLLKKARVTVIGCGGVGGITLLSLARMGIENIHIIDMDVFEHTNINRQMLSSISKMGKHKAICAQESLLDINPNVNLKISLQEFSENNAEVLLRETDIVIDATDNLVSRVLIHKTAQNLQIPSVWIAVSPPFRGGVMSFTHQTLPYEKVFRSPSYNKKLTPEIKKQISEIKNQRALASIQFGASEEWALAFVEQKASWTVLCPVANMVGLLASFEAFKFIINRPYLDPVYAPNLIRINLGENNMVCVESPLEGSWDNALL
jgi:molybdopterin/thiamine biosynthesis adenylyltransferase